MSRGAPIFPATPGLSDVFALLDCWRHFPAYRLEPRADPFFALFLPAILEDYCGSAIHCEVIPEFPLRRGTLFGEGVPGRNKSKRVDFVACTEDRNTVFLVELKTDLASRSEEQDTYLEKAQEVGLPQLITGIAELRQWTNQPKKYAHLHDALARLELLDRTGDAPKLKIIYIQPQASSSAEHTIDFARVARVVEERGALGATFAPYLRTWSGNDDKVLE